jgi:hypothetical protein
MSRKKITFAPNYFVMAITTIIHLELKDTDEHYYFGSLKALTDMFGKDKIGIGYASLRNYFYVNSDPENNKFTNKYENKKCIIRKGDFIQTKTNRGQGRKNNPDE